jgi:dTDP-4-amino-4,6-dideoxygalactose transaminase/nucleoside-diphosphate-sugar epimerase
MRVLVTGGGGYLGATVVETLLGLGHPVRVLDRFCFGRSVLSDLEGNPALEVVDGDIRRLQELPDLLDDVQAVVHLAGLSNDPTCDLDADTAADVNVESTLELARRALQMGVRRFVFGSTCSVYGKGVFELLDEASPPSPVSTFAQTKLRAEQGLLKLRAGGLEPVIARTASMFGVSRRMRYDLAVNLMTGTAVREGRIIVRGGGGQWRPFVHVRDAAEALVRMVEAPAARVAGEIFNVGSDEDNHRVRDLAGQIARLVGHTAVETPADDDDLRTYRVVFEKIAQRLDFRPARRIADGVAEVRAHLAAQPGLDLYAPEVFNVARMRALRALPVDQGGEPLAARFIPLAKPDLGEEEEQAVLSAMRSGWLTSGPQIGAFQEAFCRTVEAPHAVAVVSCTAALHLALVDIGVGRDDEVITSPITWSSTGNTILNMGARPVFVDVEPGTLNLDPAGLEAAITSRTKAIMPVHMAGQPCNLDAIHAVAGRHGIPVVEDAAHALGAAYKGQPIGARGPYACFSFYAIKNITTMEGGMITLQDPERAARVHRLAFNGMSATAWDRYGRSAITRPMEVIEPGYKYLLGNVAAAMGLVQIGRFPQFKEARRRIAHMYRAVLGDVDEIELLDVVPDVEHAWHLFIIKLRLDRLSRNRDEIAYDLRRENIGTGIHFHALHLHQYYRETLRMRPEDCPRAAEASHHILSLPLHPLMSDKNVHEVVAALKKVLHHARK